MSVSPRHSSSAVSPSRSTTSGSPANRAEERLRIALEAARLGTWEYDLRTHQWQLDEHAQALYGLPATVTHDDQGLKGVIADEDIAPMWDCVRAASNPVTGGQYECEYRVLRPDGSVRWLAAWGQVEFEGEGAERRAVRMVGASRDVTDRKETERALRESQRRFRAVLDHSLDAAYRRDLRTDTYDYMSPVIERITGYSPEEMASMPVEHVFDLVHPDDVARVRADLRRLGSGGAVLEYRFRRKDGSYRWLADSAVVHTDKDGTPAFRSGFLRDITERKHAEAEREALMEALREADRRKDEFLAILSHELRNPLTPIRNGVYVLEHTPAGSEPARRALQVIGRQVQQITRLIDDLLDVTRITRGKITLQREPLDLSVLVRSTAEDHRALFERAGLSLVVEDAAGPLLVNGDRVRLAQMIGNLLHNAAKFTPRGGRTMLSLARDGQTAIVRVADTGAGIPPDMLEHVFEPFIQAQHTLDRTHGGLGLGLALVKGLVAMHGGTVTAASDGAGTGAAFTIALPLAPTPTRATAATRAAGVQRRTGRRRVLVIEDNPDAAESIREVLELHGHTVAIEYSGSAGVETARRFLPHVVLCDIGLPGLDGYSVARTMRADAALRSALLVAVSGYALEEDVRKSRDAGFDAHIAKPPSVEELQDVLARAAAPLGVAPGTVA